MTARFRSVQPCDPWHPMRRCAQRGVEMALQHRVNPPMNPQTNMAQMVSNFTITPPKTNTFPEKERLENDFPFEIASFLGDVRSFSEGVYKLMILWTTRFFLQPFRFTWTKLVSLSLRTCENSGKP